MFPPTTIECLLGHWTTSFFTNICLPETSNISAIINIACNCYVILSNSVFGYLGQSGCAIECLFEYAHRVSSKLNSRLSDTIAVKIRLQFRFGTFEIEY